MSECIKTERYSEDKSAGKLRYNFVFFFANQDYWRAILGRELYENENVRVYEGAFEGSRFLKKLFHLHWAYRINRKIRLPFKRIWFRRMYRQDFAEDLPLCFVYMGGNNIRYDGGFCDYVRRRSPQNRQVVIHQDLIAKKISYDYSIVKNKVDLAVTYDKAEAEKYGISYFPETVFSKIVSEPENVAFEQDVYFLGAAKDRLPKILSVHRRLTDAGLRCKFQIAGVTPEDQVPGMGIEYISGIPYIENLENVIRSRCVLELIQGESVDITTRALEAIAYRRKLLTDCQICDPAAFHEGQLQVFTDPETIDLAFFDSDPDRDSWDPKIDMDPLRRLYFIQEHLEASDGR